jgi:hypothetical protein
MEGKKKGKKINIEMDSEENSKINVQMKLILKCIK